MQRVRIGLTGLAFVFLAVLLAAVFTRPTADEAPITPNSIELQRTGDPAAPAAAAPEPSAAEPLAELGVAPGNVASNSATPAESTQPPTQPAPAPAVRR